MEGPSTPYLTVTGIPVEARPSDDDLFLSCGADGAWRLNHGEFGAELEAECGRVRDALAEAIFGDLKAYQDLLPRAPDFLFSTGLNSEAKVSSLDFERVVAAAKDARPINKLLYLADCGKLVSGIEQCTKEALLLQGEFYRALNLDLFYSPQADEADGARWVTSPAVTRIHATLGFLFVRLHSLLDYSTKLAFEAEHLRTDFSSYPRLASIDIRFGDRKRVAIARVPGTLFEACDVVTQVDLYRDHIIHDGLMDDLPKVYIVVESGKTVAKFILLPDRGTEGRLEKFKNRNLFYSRADRINLRLPALVAEFQQRQLATLARVRRSLAK
jgi:hypothetical protein